MGALAIHEHLPHYTYDDYAQWQGRWEIIEGVPYAMSPAPRRLHQMVSGKIHHHLSEKLQQQSIYVPLLPIDWVIETDTVLQPDNIVVRDHDWDSKLTETPQIAFEVLSVATSKKDRELKSEVYAKAGLPYYVIVDADRKEADIFELENGIFQLRQKATTEKFIFKLPGFSLMLDFSQIWV